LEYGIFDETLRHWLVENLQAAVVAGMTGENPIDNFRLLISLSRMFFLSHEARFPLRSYVPSDSEIRHLDGGQNLSAALGAAANPNAFLALVISHGAPGLCCLGQEKTIWSAAVAGESSLGAGASLRCDLAIAAGD
jgi:hypothetical protein